MASVAYTNMGDCYDVDIEHNDDACPSTTNIPFGIGPYSKSHSASPVTMFYPQLSGYDIHPLLINRRQSHDKLQIESSPNSETSTLTFCSTFPKDLIKQTYKEKQEQIPKGSGQISDESDFTILQGEPFTETIPSGDSEASDYTTKSRKSFTCTSCGKAFKFQTSLLRHNNKVHISKYQCPTCSRVFSRQAYLDVHTSKQGSSCYLGSGYTNPTMTHSPKSDSSSTKVVTMK